MSIERKKVNLAAQLLTIKLSLTSSEMSSQILVRILRDAQDRFVSAVRVRNRQPTRCAKVSRLVCPSSYHL
jgi:hypothetical protein